jgi:tetratricopeptide (TPR) repeat protein
MDSRRMVTGLLGSWAPGLLGSWAPGFLGGGRGRAKRSGDPVGLPRAVPRRREMPILPARSGHSCQHRAVSDDDVPPPAPQPPERQPDEPSPRPAEPESAYELLQRGTALMRRRHNAQAAVVLERAARLEPGKGSILEALGRAYFTSGQHERARETFEALLEVDPSSHYGHYALGRSLKNLGRFREARTHLRLAVALSPTTAMYRATLARMPDPPAGS